MKKVKDNKGITIISLVITIIIMVILAGVTIKIATDGGLFDYAKNAVGETENAIKQEQQLVNDIMDEYFKPNSSGNVSEDIIGVDGEIFSSIYTSTQNYTDVNGDTAVIPKGFSVGKSQGINTINEGLVIQDEEGNQFVWIPVEVTNTDTETSIASFYRSAWENNERINELTETSKPNMFECSWTDFMEPYENGYVNEKAEYNEMLKSVYENGGFYIGRYETGSTTARTELANGTTEMVVKRDAYPYVFVGWGASMNDYISDVIYDGENQGKGALYLSKSIYEGENVGVTSTLCYGIQWDAMLDFIKDEHHNVTNSTNWGNFKDSEYTLERTTAKYTATPNTDTTWTSIEDGGIDKNSSESYLLTTGASDNFVAKNIYDVAGNADEWTNVAYGSELRSYRGGYYDIAGSENPAAHGYNRYPYFCGTVGFRITLYIK